MQQKFHTLIKNVKSSSEKIDKKKKINIIKILYHKLLLMLNINDFKIITKTMYFIHIRTYFLYRKQLK